METVSQFLAMLRSEYQDILKRISSARVVSGELLPCDPSCRYKLGESKRETFEQRINRDPGDLDVSVKSRYKCRICDIFAAILDFTIDITSPFLIKSVSNSIFIFKRTLGVTPMIKRESLTIFTDKFTNGVLIHNILTKVFTDKGIRGTEDIITAFICDNVGWELSSFESVVKLKEVDSISAGGIISQVILLLRLLINHDFMIGKISEASIKVWIENIDYGVVKSSYRCGLANLEGSSINFNGIRICPALEGSIKGLPLNIDEFKLVTEKEKIYFFKYTGDIISTLHNLPTDKALFRNAINTYIYMILLYYVPNIKTFINSNDKFKALWEDLWLFTELGEVNAKIEALDVVNEVTILHLLEGLYLRYDATDYAWKCIEKMK